MNTDYLCENKLAAEEPQLHRLFKDSVFGIQGILTSYQSLFPAFTDHSSLHSMHVIDFCNRLIAENIARMNCTEIYVLLMSCYLHDVGMGISENDFSLFSEDMHRRGIIYNEASEGVSDTVRKFHHEFSGEFIRKYAPFFDIPSDEMVYAIEQVSRGHRKTNLFDPAEYPEVYPIPGYESVCLPYLAALIRLADELDIASDRIFDFLVDDNVVATNPVSAAEYAKHRAIKHLIITDDEFILQVKTDDDKLFDSIVELRQKLEDTMLECRRVIIERTPFSLSQKSVGLMRLT